MMPFSALNQSTEPTPDQRQVNGNWLGAGEIRLNLGGRDTRINGFLNVDLKEGETTDIVADCSDLRRFEEGSVKEIYASNILEHFPHPKTLTVLKEWHRVLVPKGKLYVSVPDFNRVIDLAKEFGFVPFVRNLLFGDQGYDLAFHYTCFTMASLAKDVIDVGFSDIKRLGLMPYNVADCSANADTFHGKLVSLNVEITK